MGTRPTETPADGTLAEQRIAALRHPHVVALTRSGDWYVIDRKQGLSLSDLQNLGVALDPRQTVRILFDALLGLDAVHRFGSDGQASPYVHGELCPASILAGRDGAGRVVPVAMRRLVGGALHDASGYLAPEKLLGDALDLRADVFSVGVLLWEAVAGRRLFPDGRVDAVVTQLVGGKLPPLLCPPHAQWAAGLEPVIMRALSVDPAQRWPSVAVIAAHVENVTRGQLALPRQVAELVVTEIDRNPSARPSSGNSSLTPLSGLVPRYEVTGSGSGPPPVPPSTPAIYARREPPPPGQIAWEHAGNSSRPPRAISPDRAHGARQAKLVGAAIAISVVVAAASAYVLIFGDGAPAASPSAGSILVTQPGAVSAPALELPPPPAESAANGGSHAAAPVGSGSGHPTVPSAAVPARPASGAPAPRPNAPAAVPPPPAPPARPSKPRPDPKEVFGI